MEKAGCDVIIGYSYLTDLLLVNNKIKNIKIPIFTPYATANNLSIFSKNIFFFRPNQNFLASKMINYLKMKKYDLKNVLLITDVGRSQTLDYKKSYAQLLREDKISFDSLDILENDPKLIEKLQTQVNKRKYKYIFLLSGAVASAKIANALTDKDIVFIGTENFGSSTSKSFVSRLGKKNITSMFCRNLSYLDLKNKKLQSFSNEYRKQFEKMPTLLSAYTYDASSIIIKALYRSENLNMRSFLSEGFEGVTGIKISNKKRLVSSYYSILSVVNNDYELVQ
jgi:ABC-type branched-subunit amino acid transport system substrate-binding protein